MNRQAELYLEADEKEALAADQLVLTATTDDTEIVAGLIPEFS